MPMYGKIYPFEGEGAQWADYLEQVNEFFIANEITDEVKKKSIFLASCGPACYAVLRNLVSPDIPGSKSFQSLTTSLSNYYAPRPSEIVSRYRFHSRTRAEGESVMFFVSELRNLAKYCNFNTVLEDMLRDRLVCGINSDKIQERLFSEATLSFGKAVEIAVAMESAFKDTASVQEEFIKKRNAPSGSQEANINRIVGPNMAEAKKDKTQGGKEAPVGYKCWRCGFGHLVSSCRHRNSKCFKCNKIGHLAKVCQWKGSPNRTKRTPIHKDTGRENKGKVNAISYQEDSSDEEEVYALQTIFTLDGKRPPIMVSVKMHGITVPMELDTGAALSVMSKQSFDKYLGQVKSLTVNSSKVKLKGYFGQQTRAIGQVSVLVKYQDYEDFLPLCIVPGEGPSLLGRDWMEDMGILSPLFDLYKLDARISLIGVLDRFKEVFDGTLGAMKNVVAHISMPDNVQPKFFKSRPVPFAVQGKIESELDRLVSEGILIPVRYSDWAAPIMAVPKADGSVRVTADFKVTVNAVSNLEQYPVPLIDELFVKLSGGKKFTKLDLNDAYFQMCLEDSSQKYVTINTCKGLFRYTRLPQGLASAPAIFIRAMDGLLGDLKKVAVFFDDILVTGEDDKEHLLKLAEVLNRLEKAGLKLKRSKCRFMQEEVTYLGYRLDKDGLHPTHEKVQAVQRAPEPQNVKELQAFLGLLNHYRRFMPNLSHSLAPLHELLKADTKWEWNRRANKAFSDSKTLLTSEDLLVFFDPKKPIIVSCDASPYGVGAVLSHRFPDGIERPVGFVSRSLSAAEKNYAHLDKEALALIFAVVKFHQYLFGFHFELQTDHKPLLGLFGAKKPLPALSSPRIIRWAIMLSAYDFELTHKPGNKNGNADALSRLPVEPAPKNTPRPVGIFMLEKVYPGLLSSASIAKYTNRDPVLAAVREHLWTGGVIMVSDDAGIQHYLRRQQELSVQENCVLWGSRVVVPPQLHDQVLDLLHEGHPGMTAMKSMARLHLWWPNLDKDIEDRVRSCGVCQTFGRSPPAVPMQPWPLPGRPWSRLHIDHAGPFKGRLYLVVVDAFSKWIEIKVVSSTSSKVTIANLRAIFAGQGLPDLLVSDNGSAFNSLEFRSFLKDNGIQFMLVPPYHPSSNGAAERSVQLVKNKLKKLGKGDIETQLARVLLNYRSQIHSVTGVSPAELLCKRKFKTLIDCMHPNLARKVAHKQLKSKLSHDEGTRHRHLEVGNAVFVRNFRGDPKWLPGTIEEMKGAAEVMVKCDGKLWRRHLDHIKYRSLAGGPTISESVDRGSTKGGIGVGLQEEDWGPKEELDMPKNEVVEENRAADTPKKSEGATESGVSPVVLRRSARSKRKPVKLDL